MPIKKIISLSLLLILTSLEPMVIAAQVTEPSLYDYTYGTEITPELEYKQTQTQAPAQQPENLNEFIKTTENIIAGYTYPSMRQSVKTPEKVSLPSHTPIVIRCNNTIDTKNVVSGSNVDFSIVNDVKGSSGEILIKAGTPVTAQISFKKDKSALGKSGELTISDFHTLAVDGSYVPLSGTLSSNPDDKMTLSIVLSVLLCPLFLLMKGEDAQVLAGTTKTVYTTSTIYIKP